MLISVYEFQNLVGRMASAERAINDLIVAISNFVTLDQVHGLQGVLRTDLDLVKTDLESLRLRVEAIEAEPL